MKTFLKIAAILLLLGLLAGGAGFAGLYYWAVQDLPKIKTITDYEPSLTTTIYTSNDKVLGYLAEENRFLRSMDEMAQSVPRAFLASEDSGFYEHGGIDIWGIVRAAIKNLKAGTIVQGGSTITQQVIKSLLLTPERSYKRKMKEAILAYRLEKYLSKKEILTIYLNEIYLGQGAYGVEAAAREYFAKHASELTLAESALLAGLPKAPSRYNPYRHPKMAKQRQKYVLRQMRNLGWIDQEEYSTAVKQPLEFESMEDPSWKAGAYYLEEVRRWLLDRYGRERTMQGGLNVYTAVDMKHQKAAEASVKEGLVASTKRRGWRGPIEHLPESEQQSFLNATRSNDNGPGSEDWFKVLVRSVDKGGAKVAFGNQTGWIDTDSLAWCRELDPSKAPEEVPDVEDARTVLEAGDVVWASSKGKKDEQGRYRLQLQQKPVVEGALVSMDPKTGLVRALVGGYSFQKSQFNRATQAERQTGSAFKPIVYSAALDHGYTPASMVLDAPIVYTDQETNSTWKPQNYERMTYGPTLLGTALVKSRNLVTIRVARDIGIDAVIQRAKTMGLEADFPRDLSVSLGSGSVTLVNLCKAFSGFARSGSIIEPRLVTRIEDAWGETIFESEKRHKRAISPQTSYMISYLMQEVVQRGTGWRAKALKRPVAGKTGTTDEQKDAWFMGFAPYLLTGVYVGFDDPRPMGKYETGSRAAAPIWLGYRQAVEDAYPVQDFDRPQGIVMARVDAENGLLAGPGTQKSYLLPFKAGTQPERISPKGVMDEGSSDGGGDGESTSKEEMLKHLF
jgi:penicillin-binding protein 1A